MNNQKDKKETANTEYIKGAMDKLLSRLLKNENTTGILF